MACNKRERVDRQIRNMDGGSQTDLYFDSEPELDDDITVYLTPDVEGGEHQRRAEYEEAHEHAHNLTTPTLGHGDNNLFTLALDMRYTLGSLEGE